MKFWPSWIWPAPGFVPWCEAEVGEYVDGADLIEPDNGAPSPELKCGDCRKGGE